MTKQNNGRKRRDNRATDPFGGPTTGNSRVSIIVAVAALAFFLVLQWSGGDLGGLLNAPAAPAAPATIQPTPTAAATVEIAAADIAAETAAETVVETGAVEQVTPTLQPTPAPTDTDTDTTQASGVQAPRATTAPTPTANAPPPQRASDLPTIDYADLPAEAHDTIALVEQDGPFPFSRDGLTFQNRERLLPLHPEGYYREYTVITPGESTRGARRIVTGEGGEMYYTDDHYASFREIVR